MCHRGGGGRKIDRLPLRGALNQTEIFGKRLDKAVISEQLISMALKIEATRESELAKVLGINRKALSDLRLEKLRFSIDWYREDTKAPEAKRPVWITAEGMVALAVILGIKTEQIESEKQNFSAADAAETVECLVVQAFPRNPTLVQVVVRGQNRMMRVRDNRKWTRGMKVMARQESGMSKFLIPLRNPRFFGKF